MDLIKFADAQIGQKVKFLSDLECTQAVNLLGNLRFSSQGSLLGDANSTYNYSSFENEESRGFYNRLIEKIDIDNKLQDLLNEYCTQMNMSRVKVKHLWANKQYKDSLLMVHSHDLNAPDQAVVSGAIYIKVDDLSSGIKFVRNNQTIVLSPTLGSIVLFPSWLLHGGAGLNQSEERIILSFNAA